MPGTSAKALEHQGVCEVYQVGYLLPYIYIYNQWQAGVILETGKLPLFFCFVSTDSPLEGPAEEHSYA